MQKRGGLEPVFGDGATHVLGPCIKFQESGEIKATQQLTARPVRGYTFRCTRCSTHTITSNSSEHWLLQRKIATPFLTATYRIERG